MIGRFQVIKRTRPVDLVSPVTARLDLAPAFESRQHLPQPAPYATVQVRLSHRSSRIDLEWSSGDTVLAGWFDPDRAATGLTVTDATGRTTHHRSRRHGRPQEPVGSVALSLTGTHMSILTRSPHQWAADQWSATRTGVAHWKVRGRVDLAGRIDTRDETWLAGLVGAHRGEIEKLTVGGFGQIGLRDLRVVSHADGTPYREDGQVLMTATSAGPGFFDTAHTSVWALDPETLTLAQRADLYFRRPDRPGVFGDHASHLIRDGDRWLVATSTWGDFDRSRPGARVRITLAESSADLTRGQHLLDTRDLAVPVNGLASVGVWDPHLVRTDAGWLVGFVSARKYFDFRPALAAGPSLDQLTLRGAARGRRASEGTTLLRDGGEWRVLASDGRDNLRRLRGRFPMFDLDMREVGTMDAPYPTNIPWPTLVPEQHGWLMVAFNGRTYGGPLPGYGTHGDVVLMRAEA